MMQHNLLHTHVCLASKILVAPYSAYYLLLCNVTCQKCVISQRKPPFLRSSFDTTSCIKLSAFFCSAPSIDLRTSSQYLCNIGSDFYLAFSSSSVPMSNPGIALTLKGLGGLLSLATIALVCIATLCCCTEISQLFIADDILIHW